MRIGSLHEWINNAYYRNLIPLGELRRRGHDVVFATERVDGQTGRTRPERLLGCDVVLGYRMLGQREVDGVLRAMRRGAAFVWDTDDDVGAVPRESPHYRAAGGRAGRQNFANSLKLARAADLVTTSTEPLAALYRGRGVERVAVVDNHLDVGVAGARRRRHDGIVIGWTAGREHATELPRIPVGEALERVLDARPDVRVTSIGLDLRLRSDRYTHHPQVPFERLQEHVGGWDVGIAPLSDIPFNRTRSNVKLKEYGAAGTPWLASPIGPYAELGEAEGGRLVRDDGWPEALEGMLGSRFARRRLGRRARSWARSQTIDRAGSRWEELLQEAVERRRARAA